MARGKLIIPTLNWYASAYGYECVEGNGGMFLREVVPDQAKKPYNPMANPRLFRKFAQVELSPEAVVEFANTYGFLGVRQEGYYYSNERSEIDFVDELQGKQESLKEWHRQIRKMKGWLEVWTLIDDYQDGKLSDLIRRCKEASERSDIFIQQKKTASGNNMGAMESAMSQLASQVNYELRGQATPCLCFNPNNSIDSDAVGLVWANVPSSLGGALWLQFANEIAGTKRLISCSHCHKAFWVGTETRRDAEYCSGACKQAAYRSRREKKDKSSPHIETGTGNRD